ncbi:MAG TPA: type I methionyl aminopeptidase [Egibacteraceae bacterium]|nr:type I methionyl aminopeptidase [Egibacteraceae bacterium]
MREPKRNEPCWCGSGEKFKRCHHPEPPPATAGAGREWGGPAPTAVLHRVRPGTLGATRTVPAPIRRPEYAETGDPGPRRPATVKGPEFVERMRSTGRAARAVLDRVVAAVEPGITTDELDRIAHEETLRVGAYPSPLNYHGFPKSLCTSVNEVICHGIPDDRPLAEGDIVNCDVTIYRDGVHGDNSVTVYVGEVDEESRRLVEATYEAMMLGIAAARPGARVRDIGRAIQEYAEGHGLGVVRAFVGHGVGEQFHTEPIIPHYYAPEARTVLRPGMTFTVEPMLTLGTPDHVMWDDGWTAVTADLRRTAQFEHTVLVTENGVEILTLPEGEPQPFAH